MKQLKQCTTAIRLPSEMKELIKYYSKQYKVTQSEFIRDSILNQINRAQNISELKQFLKYMYFLKYRCIYIRKGERKELYRNSV